MYIVYKVYNKMGIVREKDEKYIRITYFREYKVFDGNFHKIHIINVQEFSWNARESLYLEASGNTG